MRALGAHPLTRAGLGAGILAALVGIAGAGGAVATGPASGPGAAEASVGMPGAILLVFAALAVALGVALLLDVRWTALAGTGIVAAAVFLPAVVIASSRLSDDIAPGGEVALGRAGWLLAAAALIATAGLVLCLAGMREWVRPPAPGAAPQGTPNEAIAALVLGLGGIGGVTAALAVAFAILGLGEIRLSGGVRGGRAAAVGGLVLGLLSLAFWALVLAVGILAVSPSAGGG
jgi:hypothetical protein